MDKLSDDLMCRICFNKQDTVFSLFRKRNGTSPCEQLTKIGLKLDTNDTGPSRICCECLTELEITIKFLEKCEKSNQKLAEICSRSFEFADEIEEKKEDNLNIERVNGSECEKGLEYAQDVGVECDDGEDLKSVDELVPDARCEECGSRRRCQHWAPPTSHTCPYCPKVFTRKFNFKIHLCRHGGRAWRCAQCGARAVSRWLAARHCAPRPRRACPVPGCGKTYTTNTNLSTHLRGHYGEKPFECNDCGKKFSSKNTLQNHIRIHTGALPYICPICGKQFRTNKMSAHMATHTEARPPLPPGGGARAPGGGARAPGGSRGAAPHVCALCPARYYHRQSLNKHVKKQHGQSSAIAASEVQIQTIEMSKEYNVT